MDSATERVPGSVLTTFLAGLQAGMIAAFWMFVWLGVSSLWTRRNFWAPANIMATVLHGGVAVQSGFGSSTPSGIALYLMIYSLLGAAFALLVRQRLTALGTFLVSILFSLAWYWLWFRAIAKHAMPLLWLLHAEKATQFGHVLFGALLARFGDYLPRAPREPIVIVAEGAD
jgi:hypothetical protein